MKIEFSRRDRDEAKRLNAKLDWAPRFRMQTTGGRLALNLALWIAELYPLVRRLTRKCPPELISPSIQGGKTNLRVFRPHGASAGVVVHFHGGGWTIGNARMSDGENARLAAALDVTVVAVDYHLALSRSLDEVIDECAAVGAWLLDHAGSAFGSDRILFKGSSAGAHLAASALLRLRGRHADFEKIRGAVLAFGLYDLAGTGMVRDAGPETLILHGPTVRTTLKKLTPHMTDAKRRDGQLSPLHAKLEGLPPALFLVGERDMLLEDNQLMARAWQKANGNATLIVAPESPHAFDRFDTAIARKVKAVANDWTLKQLRSRDSGSTTP